VSILVPIILAVALAVSLYGRAGTIWHNDNAEQTDKSDDSSKDNSDKDKSDGNSKPGKSSGAAAPSKAKGDAGSKRHQ
jgi:hypothetical protein